MQSSQARRRRSCHSSRLREPGQRFRQVCVFPAMSGWSKLFRHWRLVTPLTLRSRLGAFLAPALSQAFWMRSSLQVLGCERFCRSVLTPPATPRGGFLRIVR